MASTDGGYFGILMVGASSECPLGESRIFFERSENGQIKSNTIIGGQVGININGTINIQIKDNVVTGANLENGVGILLRDDKARFVPDDGPIALGTVKGNVITDGAAGIFSDGTTTLKDAVIKDNTISSSSVANIGFFGLANGFTVHNNNLLGSPAVAPIFLTEDTFNNTVRVGSVEDVLDLGDNVVIVK